MNLENRVESLKREVTLLRDKLMVAELNLGEAQRAKIRERVRVTVQLTSRKQTTKVE